MDYTRNEDYYYRNRFYNTAKGPSYNQVLDVEIDDDVTELFDVAEFKEWGKIDSSVENSLIALLITSSRIMCERYTGVSFIPKEIRVILNNSNGGIFLPYGPIGTISDVNDIDGNEIPTTDYKVTGNLFKQLQYPTLSFIDMTYTGGYTTCPENIVTAVKMQTLYLFENRGDENKGISPDVRFILNPLIRK